MRPRTPSVRIDTRKNFAEIDRGWPIEGHGTRNEVLRLCFIGLVSFLGAMANMFPQAQHRKTMADFLRTAADAIEDGSVLPGVKGTD